MGWKYLRIILFVFLLFQTSQIVHSKTQFSSAYDVDKNATKEQIIINLVNSTKEQYATLKNATGNFSLELIELEDAVELNDSQKWIWVYGSFFELRKVLIIEDKYFLSIQFNLTPIFEGEVEKFFGDFDRVELSILIEIDTDEVNKDNVALNVFDLIGKYETYPMDYDPVKNIHTFKKEIRVNKNNLPYPFDEYYINFTVKSIPTVINNTEVIEGETYPTYGRHIRVYGNEKLVYFKNLKNKSDIISDSIEEGVTREYWFENNNLLVKRYRNNKDRWILSLFAFFFFCFFLNKYLTNLMRSPSNNRTSKTTLEIIAFVLVGYAIVNFGFVSENFIGTWSGLPFLIIILWGLYPLKSLRRGVSNVS